MDEQSLNSGGSVKRLDPYKSIYDANGNINDTNWMNQMFKDNTVQQSYVVVLAEVVRITHIRYREAIMIRKV